MSRTLPTSILLIVALPLLAQEAPPPVPPPLPPHALFRLTHGTWPGSIAFSSDGKTLATGTSWGTLHLWDVATGKEIRKVQGHKGQLPAVMAIAARLDEK